MDEPTLTLMAGGDVAPVIQPVDRLAEKILPTLQQADFTIAQCERTYSDRGAFPGWQTIPRGEWSCLDPEYASVYRAAGIDIVSVASNHALDFGWEPLADTIELFRGWGMEVIGGGSDEEEARRPAIIEKDGVRVAILAYCSVLRDGQAATGEHPGLAAVRARTWYQPVDFQPGCPPLVGSAALEEDVAALERDIRAARERADSVVLFLHWGLRWIPKVLAEYQRPLAHAAIDAGADLIIGHHAHAPKAVEVYRGKVCFYSIGNFMSTGNLLKRTKPRAEWNLFWYDPFWDEGSLYSFPRHCKQALLPKVTFTSSGVARVAVIPLYMNRLAQPEPLATDDHRFEEALANLEWVSDQVPHDFRVDGDEIVVEA